MFVIVVSCLHLLPSDSNINEADYVDNVLISCYIVSTNVGEILMNNNVVQLVQL